MSGILAVADSANDARGDPPVVGMLNRGYKTVAQVPHGFSLFSLLGRIIHGWWTFLVRSFIGRPISASSS
ncbi:MAG: hypothetical protein M0Z34_01910 [Nitrospiraceae bacterium]|nr:hypothetical protein [Nitrospiraceae bacterium]